MLPFFEVGLRFGFRKHPKIANLPYYGNGPTLDIDPGPQSKFFWQIERGVFAKELPLLTALAQSGRTMLYLDTHDRNGSKP